MSITQNKMTYIMVPHSGGSCELSDGSEVFGSGSCYGVATWDDYHSAFRSTLVARNRVFINTGKIGLASCNNGQFRPRIFIFKKAASHTCYRT